MYIHLHLDTWNLDFMIIGLVSDFLPEGNSKRSFGWFIHQSSTTHLTQDTNGKVTNSYLDTTNEKVDLALDFIRTCDTNNKFIIVSDSLSVLKAMNHTNSKNPPIQKLLEKCHELLANKEIVLCWISSHIGILGNEMLDQQARGRSGSVEECLTWDRRATCSSHRRHCVVVLEQDTFILA